MLKLIESNNSILQTPALNFDFSDNSVDPLKLATEMLEFMRNSNGIGLAAPQIGLSLCFFITDCGKKPRFCFNPNIINSSDKHLKYKEGCLSFPGLYLSILRPEIIEVQYQDENGDFVTDQLHGIESRCFQHELDHLHGIVFTSRVKSTTLRLARLRKKPVGRRNI